MSQVEWCYVVVDTIVVVSEDSGTGWSFNIRGDWDVDHVTVGLTFDLSELGTDFFSVGDWGLSWGQPCCWLLSNCINSHCTLSVPGSKGGEGITWHGEEWGHVTIGQGVSRFNEASCVLGD